MNELVQIAVEITKNIGASIPFLRRLKEKCSQRRMDLLGDMDRFFNVFEKLFDRCNGSLDVEGKAVLEIGPGNSLAIGLLFLACGAKKVFLVDRFKHLFWDEYDIAFHRKVLARIEKEFPFTTVASKAIIFTNSGSIDFDRSKIQCRLGDAAKLPLENSSIDIVFSNAVLEHVHDVRKAISEMSRVTKPGGFGIHEIDLRDHFFQATPLKLLRYPDWLWNLMTWNRPGYTNRLRLPDYLKLFKASGFLIEKLVSTREYKGELSSLKMARKFTGYSSNEIKTLAFWVLLQKEDGHAT